MDVYKLTEEDNGKPLTVKKDDQVVVSLVLRPANGFVWQDAGSTAGPIVGIKYEAGDPKPGSVTKVHFRFKIERTGDIVLAYDRPSDGKEAAKWFEVPITVE